MLEYLEHCEERESKVLGKGERTAPFQSREWNRSGEGGEIAGSPDELEGEGRVKIAMEKKQNMSDFRFFEKRAVRLTRRSKKREIQRMRGVMFDFSFHAKSVSLARENSIELQASSYWKSPPRVA